MGWISDRAMKTGRGVGGRRKGKTYAKDGAPLRTIVALVRGAEGLFGPDLVELECGHQTRSNGQSRARCVECKETPA